MPVVRTPKGIFKYNYKNVLKRQESEYTDDIPAQAIAFFSVLDYDPDAGVYLFPTIYRFADYLGVETRTIHKWSAAHPELAEALEEGKQRCAEMRIAYAQSEKINPNFTKFVLAAQCGLREGVDQNITVGQDGDKPFTVDIRVVDS